MGNRFGRLCATVLALSLAACSAHTESIPLEPTSSEAALERQVYAAVNEYRTARGLRALAWSDVIADQARGHSRRMASGATSLGHRDFKKRVANIGKSLRWSRAAENVVRSRSAARAVELWLRNRGHRGNIEGKYDLTGIGAARSEDGFIYFTQIFVKSD